MVIGAGATVLVAAGGFAALVVANAQDAPPVAPTPSVTVTVEPTVAPSATPTPEPVATVAPAPAPVVTPTAIPEVVVPAKPEPKPAPVVVAPEPAPAAPAVPLVQGTAPPAGSGDYVVQPGTVMPPPPPGVRYVPVRPPNEK